MKHYTKEEALERAKEFNGKESCYPNKIPSTNNETPINLGDMISYQNPRSIKSSMS